MTIVLAWLLFGIPLALVALTVICAIAEEFSSISEFVLFVVVVVLMVGVVGGFIWGSKTLLFHYGHLHKPGITNSVPAIQPEKFL